MSGRTQRHVGRSVVRAGRSVTARLPGLWGRRAREAAKWALDYGGARATGLRGWRFARAGRYTELLAAPFGDGRLLVDADDTEIGRVVYMYGGYERWVMQTAIDYLAAAGRPVAGRTFVDVGANIGTSTVDALLHFGFGRAVAFEPDPRNVRLLRLNLVLNDLAERAEVHPVAVSDADGDVSIMRQPGNSGDTRVRSAPAGTTDTVACVRLDRLVADGALDPGDVGLLWVDAQGHDAAVIRGSSSLTAAGVPLVVEYWPDGMDAAQREELEGAIAAAYGRVVDLRGESPESLTAFAADDIGRLRDEYRSGELTDLLLLP